MAQTRTFDFNAARTSALQNRQIAKILPKGVYGGYNVEIDTGTLGAGDTIKVISSPSSTSELMTREGIRVAESGPDPLATLSITTSDPGDPRIDLVVQQHTFGVSNPPATYAVVAGAPADPPQLPTVPTDAVVLAGVFVGASETTITNTEIRNEQKLNFDQRLLALGFPAVDDLRGTTGNALQDIRLTERIDGQVVLVKDDDTDRPTLWRYDPTTQPIPVLPGDLSPVDDNTDRYQKLYKENIFTATVGDVANRDAEYKTFDDAVQAVINSGARAARLYLLDDVTFSTTDAPLNIPLHIIGLGTRTEIDFQTLGFTMTPPSISGGSGAQTMFLMFENCKVTRSVSVSNRWTGINMHLTFRNCLVEDLAGASAVPFFDSNLATGKQTLIIEDSQLAPHADSSLFKMGGTGSITEVFIRNSNASSLDAGRFLERSVAGAGRLDIFLEDHTVMRSNGWTAPAGGNINIHYDGTSLVSGNSVIPTGIAAIRGEAFYSARFSDIAGLFVHEAIRFFSGSILNIAEGTHIIASASATTISTPNRLIRGAGREATVIRVTMPTSGVALYELAEANLEFQDLTIEAVFNTFKTSVFRWSASPASGGLRNVVIKAEGTGVLESAFLTALTPAGPFVFKDILITGTATARWSAGFRFLAAPADVIKTYAENIEIENWEDVGAEITGAHVKSIKSHMVDAVASSRGLLIGLAIANDCEVDAKGAGSAIASSQGIRVSSGCLLRGCKVLALDSSTQIIEDGIVVNSDQNQIHDCYINECSANGIELTVTADNNLIEVGFIFDCTRSAIEDLNAGGENALTGNYAKANGVIPGAQINGPNQAANTVFA
jgi:hypothetical protein